MLLLLFFLLAGCARWEPGWEATTPMLGARSGAAALSVGNSIYVMGGVRIENGGPAFLSSVERGRISGGKIEWSMVEPLPAPRAFAATAISGPYLYLLGGSNFNGLLASVLRTRIADNTLSKWEEMPPMTTSRRAPAAFVWGKTLWALGGFNGSFLSTIERANILPEGLSKWELAAERLTTDRYIHGAALLRGGRTPGVYVVGGHNERDGRPKNDAEWAPLSPAGPLRWRPIPSLPRRPRFLAPAIVAENFLYLIGGYDGDYLQSVEEAEILPEGGLGVWREAAPLSVGREGAAVVLHQGRLYALGGSRRGIYLDTVERARVDREGRLWRKKG